VAPTPAAVTNTAPVAAVPEGVAVTSDGRTAVVADAGDGTINILLDLFYVAPRDVGRHQPVRAGHTLVLSVFERTRELGMLRAVGMTRPVSESRRV
jgi:hypothetical protein